MFKQKWANTTQSLTYNSWRSMRGRCLLPSYQCHDRYKHLSIDPSWAEDFDKFVGDMGDRPPGTTLDRIDGTLGYSKENCRWATHRTQQNNKPNLTQIEHEGVVKTIGEWAYDLDLTESELKTVYKRHSKYGAATFEELFCQNLMVLRTSKRENKCSCCGATTSCKWRSNGTLCNTCYHKAYRNRSK